MLRFIIAAGVVLFSLSAFASPGFRPVANSGLPQSPFGVNKWGDFDNDGDLDLFVAGETGIGQQLPGAIYRNNGALSFSPLPITFESTRFAEWRDFDGDGDLDLLTVTHAPAWWNPVQKIKLYQNLGNETFAPLEIHSTYLFQALALSPESPAFITVERENSSDSPRVVHYIHNGGGFTRTVTDIGALSGADREPHNYQLRWDDFNADNIPDIVISAGYSSYAEPPPLKYTRFYRGVSATQYIKEEVAFSSEEQWGNLAPADFDDDGDLDLLINYQSNLEPSPSDLGIRIYTNNGAGAFTQTAHTFPISGGIGAAAWADFNNDGLLDLVAAGYADISSDTLEFRPYQLEVFLQTAEGSFAPTLFRLNDLYSWYIPFTVALHDLNGDNLVDISLGYKGYGNEGPEPRYAVLLNSTNLHSISGRIESVSPATKIRLTGSKNLVTTVPYLGGYRFDGLPDGEYVIDVDDPSFSFSPSQRRIELSGANRANVDFKGEERPVGVTINDEAQYTRSREVTLFIVPPSGAKTMQISNDGGFRNAKTLTAKNTVKWTLTEGGSERQSRVVYVRFGKSSVTYSDDILLDTTQPQITSANAAVVAESRLQEIDSANSVRLSISAKDNLSGVAAIQLRGEGLPTYWRKYSRNIIFNTNAKRITVRVKDRAGNVSSWRVVRVRNN